MTRRSPAAASQSSNRRQALLTLGALAASKSPQGAQALIVGGQAAAIQSQLSYTRDMEREADRVGFGVMSEAGYDPRGFVGMFGKLQQAAGINDKCVRQRRHKLKERYGARLDGLYKA